jgi:hypothetical protein
MKAQEPPRTVPWSRPGRIGALAGLVGIACCVYPVVLVLLGLSTAAAAVDLGNTLFREWGWAFRLTGASLIVVAVIVQRRWARSCPVDQRPRIARNTLIMAAVAVTTYGALYAITTWLGDAAA